MTACDLAPLVRYRPSVDLPWTAAAAQHVHRRLGFGLDPNALNAVLQQSPADHIIGALRAAAAAPPLPEPFWSDWTPADYTSPGEYVEQINGHRSAWINDARQQPWRAKMCVFWSNHFVTGLDKYKCPSWLWGYTNLLQRHAFGDFRAFVREIGTNTAMLIYLDGLFNTRFEPTENYARELLELFTLGEGNGYTQLDIQEAARALTGFNNYVGDCEPVEYRAEFHDASAKTIFGVTAAFDYDGFIDHLFAARGELISQHVCRQLYRHFVSQTVDEGVVAALATTLREADWQLLPVYEQLFASEHFMSPALRGARVKSPLDLLLGTESLLGSTALYSEEYTLAVHFLAGGLGQLLFDPPDVAGWPGDRAWINADRLAGRSSATQQALYLMLAADRIALTDWAKALQPADERDVENVTRSIADYVLPKGLPTEQEYESATLAMRSEVPSEYFDEGIWSLDFEYAPEQVGLLLDYLMNRPEYQLC